MKLSILYTLAACIFLMLNSCTGNINKEAAPAMAAKLPFIGKRSFDIHPNTSGTGTPKRYIEIKQNGDVYFSFYQQNQADGRIEQEVFFAGSYKVNMKCLFKKLDKETRYYEVLNDSIFETNSHYIRLKNPDCCRNDVSLNTESCVCGSSYDK